MGDSDRLLGHCDGLTKGDNCVNRIATTALKTSKIEVRQLKTIRKYNLVCSFCILCRELEALRHLISKSGFMDHTIRILEL